MRKTVLFALLTIALAIPALAQNDDRHQSYISYDDGGTVIRSGEDGKEIEAHRNLPVYPGDELVTARRGRAEVRLSDGNIVGIDRATAVRFRSILDAYDGDGSETVVELKYGKIGIHRTDVGGDHVRLDTQSASYVATQQGVYSVETDSRGADRVMVFDGTVEVRTPSRSTRLNAGESANVDNRGVFDLVGDQRAASDDFERWLLDRAERFGSYNSKYIDRSLAYWGDDLDEHGRWVFVGGIGYSWRPYVGVGWRPYHNGYWYGRGGYLTWVSYDPWGWGPWHYGRWSFDPGYGWIWVPGYGYSPAWVYWAYGPTYVGWAPAGWWDCHRPYYGWAYNPYRYWGHRYGYGFYGRVNVRDMDLRPWTFVDSRGVISNRVDRAALTTDAVRDRLGRNRDGMTVVGSGPARFTREEWNDPAGAIRRRGLDGTDTGSETGAHGVTTSDMSSFFRRDGNIAADVRERVVRSRGSGSGSGSGSNTAGSVTAGVGVSRRSGGGTQSVAPIGRGAVAPIGRGSVAPIGGGTSTGSSASSGSGSSSDSGSEGRRGGDAGGGRVGRGGATPPPGTQPADSGSPSGSVGRGRDRVETPSESEAPRATGPSWRDRSRERGTQDSASPSTPPSTSTSTERSSSSSSNDSWRNRVPGRTRTPGTATPSTGSSGSTSSSSTSSGSTSSDVPRRVIDGVGGARIRPRDSADSGSSSRSSSSKSGSERSSGGSNVERGSRSSSGERSSGSSSTRSSDSGSRSSGSGSSARSSDGGSRSSGSSGRSSGSSSSGNSSGGRVKRD